MTGNAEDQRYDRYRSHLAAEADWINNRTTWMLSANAFLATAMAIVSGQIDKDGSRNGPEQAARMFEGIPTVAIVVNAAAFVMLLAAALVSRKLVIDFRTKGSAAATDAVDPLRFELEDDDHPHLIGHPVAHVIGKYVPVALAAFLTYAWWQVL